MRAEGPAFREILLELLFLCRKIPRSAVHDTQAVSLHPVLRQSRQDCRLAQRIHRIGYYGENAAKSSRNGGLCIKLHQTPVGLKLRHPHIPCRTHRRDSPGCTEHEHIAVKQLVFLQDHHLWKLPAIRKADLIHLPFIAAQHPGIQIIDSDLIQDIAAFQLQSQKHRAAHISQSQQMNPLPTLCRSRRRAACL